MRAPTPSASPRVEWRFAAASSAMHALTTGPTTGAGLVLFRGRAPLNPYEERVAHEEAGIALGIPAPAFLLHGARGMRAPLNEYERTLAQHQAGVAQAAIVHEEAVYVTLRSSLRLPCGRKPRNPHEDRLALKHAGVVEAQRVAGRSRVEDDALEGLRSQR